MVRHPKRNRRWSPTRGMRFCRTPATRSSWVECIEPMTLCVRLTVCSQVQGQVSSPSFFPLSGPPHSARHRAKVVSSRPTWVGLLHLSFTRHLRSSIASAIPLLSHNITSNAKYFTQPADTPEPLALDWDDKGLPEQVTQAGGFDAILCVSSYMWETDDLTSGHLTPSSLPGWQT